MPNFIFRRIAGKIIPIRITASPVGARAIGVTAEKFVHPAIKDAAPKMNSFVGYAHVIVGGPKKTAQMAGLNVTPEWQNRGIGTEIFKAAVEHLKSLKHGPKFLRGDLVNPGMVSIREKVGVSSRYQAFNRAKGTSKLVSATEAKKEIGRYGQGSVHAYVRATTKIKRGK